MYICLNKNKQMTLSTYDIEASTEIQGITVDFKCSYKPEENCPDSHCPSDMNIEWIKVYGDIDGTIDFSALLWDELDANYRDYIF